MSSVTDLSAAATAEAVRKRELSVTEVTRAHLARAEAVNPRINALTEILAESALETARDIDNAAPGNAPGNAGGAEAQILRGVPVTTKINVDQAGCVNSNGVPAFKDNLCAHDSAVVKNLKDAGAVIIGRTNTPEFSLRWFTSNPLHGVTKNPWNGALTPGGSSGAGAAAVAAGVGCAAHGNDLGGSLRYPAFCCGVASIRPSMGRVPAYNPGAAVERPPLTQTMSVQGPIARTIADVRLTLRAMAVRSAHDPNWRSAADSGRARTGKITVGYSVNPFGGAAAHPEIESAVNKAVQGLREAGFETVEAPFPNAARAAEVWGELMFAEIRAAMLPAIREHGSAEINRVIDGYAACFRTLDFDALFAVMGERIALQRAAEEMFDKIDLYLMPTSLALPFENDLDFKNPDAVAGVIAAQRPLFAVNLLGLPAAALPTHVAEGADGAASGPAPAGVQLIGPAMDDWFVLDAAARLEAEIGTVFHQLPQ